jgi:hypothetical protein
VKRVTKRTAPPLVAWRGLQRARDIVKETTQRHHTHHTRQHCYWQHGAAVSSSCSPYVTHCVSTLLAALKPRTSSRHA